MDEDQEDFKCDFEELRVNMMNIVSWLMENGANVQFGSSTRNECLVTVIDSPKPGLFVPVTRKISLIDFLSMVANDVQIKTECSPAPDAYPQPVPPATTTPIQYIPYSQLPQHVQEFFNGVVSDKQQQFLNQMMKQQMQQQQNVSKPGQMHGEMQLPDGMPPFSLPPHLMKPTIKMPKPSDN